MKIGSGEWPILNRTGQTDLPDLIFKTMFQILQFFTDYRGKIGLSMKYKKLKKNEKIWLECDKRLLDRI